MYTVKQARAICGLTQIKMAEKMGISRDTYRKIETNPETATVKQAYDIARITNIGVDQIFFAAEST